MIEKFLISIFILVGYNLYAQTNSIAIVEKTYFFGKSNEKKSYNKLIDHQKVNILYLEKVTSLNLPFPKSLIDSNYKSESIVKRDTTSKDDYSYSTRYTYDENSRLISIYFSSCMACSIPVSDYQLIYNSNGLLTEVYNSFNRKAVSYTHLTLPTTPYV